MVVELAVSDIKNDGVILAVLRDFIDSRDANIPKSPFKNDAPQHLISMKHACVRYRITRKMHILFGQNNHLLIVLRNTGDTDCASRHITLKIHPQCIQKVWRFVIAGPCGDIEFES